MSLGAPADGDGLAAFESQLSTCSTPPTAHWRPRVFRLEQGDAERFAAVCRGHGIRMIDAIERQLLDLAALRLPGATDRAERERFIHAIVAEHGDLASYGRWVYLPWDSKIIHLLDPDAYFEVITNRNAEKITVEEQRVLRSKRIGVIGLSVGGEAAVTVAQEHLCGAIVLADFDRLDLSNLNRLNAGCDDLGEKKSVIIARRIARIDPYLEVKLFHDGVTLENLEAFLDGLDLLIEECDSLQIKREVRLHAKARRINLVYAADERGFLSVEPYACWPDLQPFHGRMERPQAGPAAFPTRFAFFEALTEWMGGWEQISKRSQRTLRQVGKTWCGYPQLASEARFAAGQLGHVARRLLLGERVPPFHGYLDLEALVPSASPPR